MGYKEEMAAFTRRLGVRTLGELSLEELAERIDSISELTAPRTQLYVFMKWLSDRLLEADSSDEESISREIATWCLFVNNVNAEFDSGNVVGTFEEWLEEHLQAEPLGAKRLKMAELEIKKFHGLPTEAPHGLVPAGQHFQPSPPAEEIYQQVSPVNEASEVPRVEGFGHIHPDRLKLSRYGDSNSKKGEVIDLDEWQRPIVDISSDEDAGLQAKNDLSFLTGSNRMVFGDDETNLTTELQEKGKNKTRGKKKSMQSAPTSVQTNRNNKKPCGRCGVTGHYHMQCPTNLDPSFDKNPPDDYKCNLCNKFGDHYATVCKRNMQPASLTQQRKRYAEQKRNFHFRRGRSSSPFRGPNDERHIERGRSPSREPRDRYHYDRESSLYREPETRLHVDKDRSRERRRSWERYRRNRSRSRSRSPSPLRPVSRRREKQRANGGKYRANREHRLRHSSRELSFPEPELSSPFHSGGLDHDDSFKHIPDAPYRPLFSRPVDIKIRGRGSSFYYDDDQKESIPASAYGSDDLMSRKRRRSQEPTPHHDDYVDGSTVDKGVLLTELTDLIATNTVSPRARAPMKNRLPEVFKNDLRQPSWVWDIGPTANTALIKPEPVLDVVREPSPPVELGVTEKRLDGRRSTQYHPVVLELFKNQKNVWLRKNDKTKRAQASSFFWDKETEEDDVDISDNADADADAGLESARDTVMTEAEPVATPIDLVMENPMTMQLLYRDETEVRTHQPHGLRRVGLKPAVDVNMEDAEHLDVSEAVDVSQDVDVSAIVDEIIAERSQAKTASEAVENEPPSVQFVTSSETFNAIETANLGSMQSAGIVHDAEAKKATTAADAVETASVESAHTVRKVEPEHADTADDHDDPTATESTQDVGASDSSDTAIKDAIYVRMDPAETETS
ncbi:hypothetical protein QBC32DRAFT_379066 [Pseudoneurospora amorphoporcata]|uniref:CCHC-type domain-containing protein n=1 Tax=Pseudoneurospora amorphoporcata TaxID=241081 RepID=A0AAN6SJN4_9PEZI|nr:hypothetical protein QBC32DRAFT_379066 [Pseudoneurospora amorphoporcata]